MGEKKIESLQGSIQKVGYVIEVPEGKKEKSGSNNTKTFLGLKRNIVFRFKKFT